MKLNKLLKAIGCITILILFITSDAFAGDIKSGISLASLTSNLNDTVMSLSKILTDIALIAGISFILASFFKFHQHKLNPTQVPISQGVTLLLIGAALTLFVFMIPTAKRAIFGSAEMAKVGGSQMSTLFGSG